jgi:hypothetical protein
MRSALARNSFLVPSALKMTDPRYQDIPSSAIPEVTDDGTHVRIICGEFWSRRGPVEGVAADPNYLDISVAPGQRKRLEIETTRNAFAYVFAGSGTFRDASDPRAVLTEQVAKPDASPINDVENHSLVLFDRRICGSVPTSVQLAFARQGAKEQGERNDDWRRSDDSYSPRRHWRFRSPTISVGPGFAYRRVMTLVSFQLGFQLIPLQNG